MAGKRVNLDVLRTYSNVPTLFAYIFFLHAKCIILYEKTNTRMYGKKKKP